MAEAVPPGAEADAAATLAKASALRHPESLSALRRAEEGAAAQSADLPAGDWPETPGPEPELTLVTDLRGLYLPAVFLARLPSEDWTEIPAHLNFGGWNDCPLPEHQVAALRSWRERYGAVLVGLGSDTMYLRVERRPKTRDEALKLAREHALFCPDIIDQGYGTPAALAAALMAHDAWFFWWD